VRHLRPRPVPRLHRPNVGLVAGQDPPPLLHARPVRPANVSSNTQLTCRSVIVFSALRISAIDDYYHSSNATYAGIPATIYALVEANSSVITTTTPLLKAFVLQFTWINTHRSTPAKPFVVLSVAGRGARSPAASAAAVNATAAAAAAPATTAEQPAFGSRRGSLLSEHEKPTAASSSGGEARPGTGE
jgi:hypothetical protein